MKQGLERNKLLELQTEAIREFTQELSQMDDDKVEEHALQQQSIRDIHRRILSIQELIKRKLW